VIAHVILFTPKPELTQDGRRDLLDSLVAASADIPAIRAFRVGRRVTHGLPGYEQMMRDDYEFAAIVEFDDLDGLKAYLRHPSHASLGRHFTGSALRSLAYDYALVEAEEVRTLTD
jgi:hypothetical protein